MKFLVRQALDEGGDVTRDHLQPMARVVAGSLEDPPRGPVVWLGGCGDIETSEFFMLFEAPDQETMDAAAANLPGLVSCRRVMAVDRSTLARGLMLGLAKDYEDRRAAEDAHRA
ncbi:MULTISPECIES: hypothetical protein [Pseudonocardia]|uniref:Uncharacterized protein n=2 Tax=Pseudonocardia TaxID=1847 RepID=A0A1Y2N9U6_PSEAH|nr:MULTISPECIES: hypothetical protein [Pseudonocardia]OSY44234.1 hypothetical protein BG845_00355 [Pseudonocardia autotrophica]TDN74036.1 hypothetical protein C8E95_3151 [Pseudonocardia autotrophica]BBG04793.1 hypothetical protein Pdca_60020 [Pseudonocardia autotrophica]GEC23449.1 hypothetical protein PSA01_04780 [Pseudonocardia saturnea]